MTSNGIATSILALLVIFMVANQAYHMGWMRGYAKCKSVYRKYQR